MEANEMECIMCKGKIKVQINGWSQGHNAEPIASGRCCDECNSIVIMRRINDFNDKLKRSK